VGADGEVARAEGGGIAGRADGRVREAPTAVIGGYFCFQSQKG
jgi:hypothetical protein